MALVDALNEFHNGVARVNSYNLMAFETDPVSGAYFRTVDEQVFITNAAFLHLFISWESFLESSFTEYMLGELSISGTAVARHVTPLTIDHARRILIGTQKYVDWANPDIVKRLANLYFVIGNPFDLYLTSIFATLIDLKHIRNAAAHLTSTTKTQLDAIASRKMNKPVVVSSISDFVFRPDPLTPGSTFLDTYIADLIASATAIATL
jgi:hypothetical protein